MHLMHRSLTTCANNQDYCTAVEGLSATLPPIETNPNHRQTLANPLQPWLTLHSVSQMPDSHHCMQSNTDLAARVAELESAAVNARASLSSVAAAVAGQAAVLRAELDSALHSLAEVRETSASVEGRAARLEARSLQHQQVG